MSAFELILKKMKNQKELTQSDYLPTELCEVLWTEVQAIDAKNEEISDSELWNTDSLCFRYFNLLQEFKTTKSTWIDWHNTIVKYGAVGNETYIL